MNTFPTHYALSATLTSLSQRLADQRATTRAVLRAVAGFPPKEGVGPTPPSGPSEAS
jgi:hypothetical protein